LKVCRRNRKGIGIYTGKAGEDMERKGKKSERRKGYRKWAIRR
jgi:hypothetical protein